MRVNRGKTIEILALRDKEDSALLPSYSMMSPSEFFADLYAAFYKPESKFRKKFKQLQPQMYSWLVAHAGEPEV